MSDRIFNNRPSLLSLRDDKKMVVQKRNSGLCDMSICDGSGLVSMRQSAAYTGVDCEAACDCKLGDFFNEKYRYARYLSQISKGWFQAQWQVDRVKNMRKAFHENQQAPF